MLSISYSYLKREGTENTELFHIYPLYTGCTSTACILCYKKKKKLNLWISTGPWERNKVTQTFCSSFELQIKSDCLQITIDALLQWKSPSNAHKMYICSACWLASKHQQQSKLPTWQNCWQRIYWHQLFVFWQKWHRVVFFVKYIHHKETGGKKI